MTNKNPPQADHERVLEALAEIEHNQWIQWSKAVSSEVSAERKERWMKLWIPYSDLSEADKEHDRVWARMVITASHYGALYRERNELLKLLDESAEFLNHVRNVAYSGDDHEIMNIAENGLKKLRPFLSSSPSYK